MIITKLKYLFMPSFKGIVNQGRNEPEAHFYHYIHAMVDKEPVKLLFTDHEIKRAADRAKKQPEDAQ